MPTNGRPRRPRMAVFLVFTHRKVLVLFLPIL
jgi:hypothetical protein